MNEEFENSIDSEDEDCNPVYQGDIKPYMFEPTLSADDIAARETAKETQNAQSEEVGRRHTEVSNW